MLSLFLPKDRRFDGLSDSLSDMEDCQTIWYDSEHDEPSELYHQADEAVYFFTLDDIAKGYARHVKDIKLERPQAALIAVTGELTHKDFETLVSELGVDLIIPDNQLDRKFSVFLQKAVGLTKSRYSRLKIARETALVNKRLERATAELNKKARERTQEVEFSRGEANKKKKQTENLVHLVRRLGEVRDYEEYLKVLREEHRSWHALVGVMLLIKESPSTLELIYSVGGVAHTAKVSTELDVFLGRESLGEGSRRQLSEILSRPVASVIPLRLGDYALLFEHTASGETLEELKKYLFLNQNIFSITLDRIQQDNALRSVAARWERTFDTFSDAVAIVSEDFSVLRSNKPFRQYSETGPCHKQFFNSDMICPGCPILKASGSRASDSPTVTDGVSLFSVSSFPIEIESLKGQKYFIHFYKDVTQSKYLYGQLVQNEKMAALGQLAGNVAHELNNPLTGIRSLSQVLKQELNEENELYGDISEIEKAAERSQRIIKNLLEFTTTKQSHNKKVSIDELVTHTLPLVKTATRSLSLNVELGAEGRKVNVEPQLIQQVIFNLISNASHVQTESGGKIWVKTFSDKKSVYLIVEDNGPGVPISLRDTIFLPFFTTKERGKGTGLGLSLCKDIIESFGGDIRYESREGGGASFKVMLPLVE